MNLKKIEELEIQFFLESILAVYGYDFRQYSRASLKRRIRHRLSIAGLTRISEMLPRVLYDKSFFNDFLNDMSITVTEMFRNPDVFKQIKQQVLPKLHTYPRVNVWHVGCATGEEAYSMAILLEEAGLLKKTRIYATDFNNVSLKIAEQGIYPLDAIQKYTKNYILAGGIASFSDYYTAQYGGAQMNKNLRDRITFAYHNLVSDGVFAEMNLVVCRNVLIYFEQPLQNRVLQLIKASLLPKGFLVLGNKESINFSSVAKNFSLFNEQDRIFRKKNEF